MANFRTEYRINKKGCECFRTDSEDRLAAKLSQLQERKPNVVYVVQRRNCQVDKRGILLADGSGRPIWSSWY